MFIFHRGESHCRRLRRRNDSTVCGGCDTVYRRFFRDGRRPGGTAGRDSFIENYLGILDSRPVKYQGSIPVEKRDDNEFEIEFRGCELQVSWFLRLGAAASFPEAADW